MSGVDVFGGAFLMLTRYEEVVVPTRDSYGRFPASASVAHREGFLGLPVVDVYVELRWTPLRRYRLDSTGSPAGFISR